MSRGTQNLISVGDFYSECHISLSDCQIHSAGASNYGQRKMPEKGQGISPGQSADRTSRAGHPALISKCSRRELI